MPFRVPPVAADRPVRPSSSAAAGAAAEDLKAVAGDGVAVVGGDPGEPVLVTECDLDRIAAGLADEVVVMAARLTAGAEELLITLRDDVGLSFGGEDVELPIDSGETDPVAVLIQTTMQVLRRDKTRCVRQCLPDGILLRGVAGGRALVRHGVRLRESVRSVLNNIITLQFVYMCDVCVHKEDGLDRAAELFKVLGNESRLWLVRLLGNEPMTVSALTEITGMSQPLVSQHLKTLRQSGLVSAIRHGKAVTYVLADEHVSHVVADALVHVLEPVPDPRA